MDSFSRLTGGPFWFCVLSNAAGMELANSKERSTKEGEGAEEQTRVQGSSPLCLSFDHHFFWSEISPPMG